MMQMSQSQYCGSLQWFADPNKMHLSVRAYL